MNVFFLLEYHGITVYLQFDWFLLMIYWRTDAEMTSPPPTFHFFVSPFTPVTTVCIFSILFSVYFLR